MSVTKVCLRCGYVFLTSQEATHCGCGGELAVVAERRWWRAKRSGGRSAQPAESARAR